jgi:DNA-binding transcriptional LysR family regulator
VDRLKTIESFIRIVKTGSFSAAARQLGISRALVSRHVTSLEKRLGARLLNRTTRRVNLTEAGERYVDFCQRIIAEMQEQESSLTRLQNEPRGSLKVIAPKSFGSLDLGDAVTSFAGKHPGIQVRLILEDFSFRSYDFVENDLDVAVRTAPLRDSGLIARKIGTLRSFLCAAPAYLARHGEPRAPLDLRHHDCLAHINRYPDEHVWRFRGPKGLIAVKIHGPFSSNSALVLRKAALAGLGIALLPAYCVGKDLRTNAVRELLPDFPAPERPIYVVYPPGGRVPEKVRCFVEFLAGWFRRGATVAAGAKPLPRKRALGGL